jgi:hypothetical protein
VTDSGSSKPNTGLIVGGVILAVAISFLLGTCLWMCLRKRRRARNTQHKASLLDLGPSTSQRLLPSESSPNDPIAEMSQVSQVATRGLADHAPQGSGGATVDRSSSRVQRWLARSNESYVNGVSRAPTKGSTRTYLSAQSEDRESVSMYSQASIRESIGPAWHEHSNNSKQELQEL